MLLRQVIQSRHFSSSRILLRPSLSADYKSKQLWDERFNCKLLSSDTNLIKSINTKIINGSELNNLETDIFINIAAPQTEDVAPLQEAANLLRKFRRTVYSHKLFPSTSHATCRLFLDSKKPKSLAILLENRIEFGVFPDSFSLNLIFDEALEARDYALASRLAALIMLQEEFGMNEISDKFALYSVSKYLESKTNFDDWNQFPKERDPIFSDVDQEEVDRETKSEAKKEEEEDDEGEEEDAEYIRIPFLRNPYFDNHFDLTNPRLICGNTLSMQGLHLVQDKDTDRLGKKCTLIGDILKGNWIEAKKAIDSCQQSGIGLGSTGEAMKFYVENLGDITPPDGDLKESLCSGLDRLARNEQCLSEEIEKGCTNFANIEMRDIEQLKKNLEDWSDLRTKTRDALIAQDERKKLIEEIKAKKEELRLKEQYLYFYDNLKKSNLTRIDYN